MLRNHPDSSWIAGYFLWLMFEIGNGEGFFLYPFALVFGALTGLVSDMTALSGSGSPEVS